MATYNGERFISAQLKSILSDIGSKDEVIIVDDCSTDGTVSVIESFADRRIRLFLNPRNRGVVKSFETALTLAVGEVIFLADQDDVWVPGRVRKMVESLAVHRAALVSTNSAYIDEADAPIVADLPRLLASTSERHRLNVFKIFMGTACYWGCAMALTKDLLKIVLPIPQHVESHDIWIALAANLLRRNVHLEESLLMRRIHGNNVSLKKRPFLQKVLTRLEFVISMLRLTVRIARAHAR